VVDVFTEGFSARRTRVNNTASAALSVNLSSSCQQQVLAQQDVDRLRSRCRSHPRRSCLEQVRSHV